MMKQMQLKRGDIVRRSVEGARGFFYPDMQGETIVVQEDCDISSQAGWHTRQNFAAYYAPCSSFAKKDRYDNHASKMIVWVEIDGQS
jgi:hypothetical protein